MTSRTTFSDLRRSQKYKGLWVALDNCRYDSQTRKPVEGDIVDADAELAELCSRMREQGRCSCTILFCEEELLAERTRRTLS